MVVHWIEAREQTLAEEQRQQRIKKERIIRRGETQPLAQKPAECAALVEAETLCGAS